MLNTEHIKRQIGLIPPPIKTEKPKTVEPSREQKKQMIIKYLKNYGSDTVQHMAEVLPIKETSVDVYVREMIKDGRLMILKTEKRVRTIGVRP